MKTHRTLRVGSVIREELAKLLVKEMDFDGAVSTITEVAIDEKMVWADVFVSVIPSTRGNEVIKQLEYAAGHLQHLLNKKLGIRPMPRIRFKIDHGIENAAAIEKKLMEDNNE